MHLVVGFGDHGDQRAVAERRSDADTCVRRQHPGGSIVHVSVTYHAVVRATENVGKSHCNLSLSLSLSLSLYFVVRVCGRQRGLLVLAGVVRP